MKPYDRKYTAEKHEQEPSGSRHKKSDLMCKGKYSNRLPNIPFDLKFISYHYDLARFIKYQPTSLEKFFKFEVHPDFNLGVQTDLINKDLYTDPHDSDPQVDSADENLLDDDVPTSHNFNTIRSKHHARNVSWLRRTEYISTEKTRFQSQTIEKAESKVGFNIKKNFQEDTLYMNRESQMKAIEKTFEDNKMCIEKHYIKPGVHAVEVLNVFPDFMNWKYPCAQVIFDSNPAPTGQSVSVQMEKMSQAMIRGVVDENNEQFVAYFLPTVETISKRHSDAFENRPYDENFEYCYKMERKYNWNVKCKINKGYEENYFLIEHPFGFFYNELETRVRLSKRRLKCGSENSYGTTTLVVRHIPINNQELHIHNEREKQLQRYDDVKEALSGTSSENTIDSDNNISDESDEQNITENINYTYSGIDKSTNSQKSPNETYYDDSDIKNYSILRNSPINIDSDNSHKEDINDYGSFQSDLFIRQDPGNLQSDSDVEKANTNSSVSEDVSVESSITE